MARYKIVLFPIMVFLLIMPIESLSQEIQADNYNIERKRYNQDLYPDEKYEKENYLTGDWGGFRAQLVELGITPTANYYMTVLGNPIGGERKSVQYAGLLNAYLQFDLEKLLNIPRTTFIASGSWASGRSLSNKDIGNVFTVSEVFNGRTVRLYQLILDIEFVENIFEVAFGRMGIGDEFAAEDIFGNYVSGAFNGNPITITINEPAFFSDPVAQWGSRIILTPVEPIQIKAGVYNSNPRVGNDNNNGFNFTFKEGALLISEAAYLLNQQQNSKGLPGKYTFGAYYDTASFDQLADATRSEDGNYGFYWTLQQMVYSEDSKDGQGLTPWINFVVSPDESINTFPFFMMGGLVYQGPFKSRNDDVAAFGFAYGTFSDDLPGQDYEAMLELTYMIQATPWLQIQPDAQWIFNPSGTDDIDDALVLGFQMLLTL
ncbi:MAG: carbohydrate porin [Thermodesulfobacteriota bacterium]